MEKNYFAHISEDGRVQTVLEHLAGTGTLAEAFASRFHSEQQGKLAGLAHDIGKYSAQFQKRLSGDPCHVDHSTAGAFECYALRQPYAAMAIAGHHGGLLDFGSRTDTEGTFLARMNNAIAGNLPDYSAWKTELSLPAVDFSTFQDVKEQMFFTRMLYSCLVDADFLDTEAFMTGQKRTPVAYTMSELWERLNAYVAPWFPPTTPLNQQRCNILNRCISEGQTRPAGLYSLTVPTGGGKTVASLAFALSQAKTSGLQRIIYVIPYTSIIEQNADVFRKILGDEMVLEHHSGIQYDTGQEVASSSIRIMQATENWDMPIIVTTAVQFFESLYSNRSSQCRKLHNIANSVIVFDEAQMLPLPYLRPCVFAIAQLVKHYGASAVLCTATQPALDAIFKQFLPDTPVTELCPPEVCVWESFRRVSFRKAGTTSWEEISKEMNALSQVLCIVNSRKNAHALFPLLNEESSFHLSTLMCPSHRRRQLQEIRSRLSAGLPCRVVSTSLIEAGVDVDFPAVYREETGLDSILQAAGRCNREGRCSTEESIVTIFRSETAPPPLFRTSIGAGRVAVDRHEDLASREAIRTYFRELLDLTGAQAQDQKGILSSMEKQPFSFCTVADKFHLIESNTRTIYIPENTESEMLIDRLRNGPCSRALFRKLNQYGVNVYPQHFEQLKNAGALEVLEDGSGILSDLRLYSPSTGLSLEAESGQALFI